LGIPTKKPGFKVKGREKGCANTNSKELEKMIKIFQCVKLLKVVVIKIFYKLQVRLVSRSIPMFVRTVKKLLQNF
jgi:hypothetical protein